MSKDREIDRKIKDLHKRLETDRSFAKELAELSAIIEGLEGLEGNGHGARWPYVDASPVSEAAWRG